MSSEMDVDVKDYKHKKSSKRDELENPGVQRIAAISEEFTLPLKISLFVGIFLISYVYGLDGSVRSTFQATATNSYSSHSLLATLNTVRAIIAAAAQPAYARIADVFGRVELICVSVFFYTLGTIVEASSNNVRTFAGGAILYQIGYTGLTLLVEIIIADITSLHNRLFLSYIPATPYLINAWVGGNVASAFLLHSTWNWGVGIFAILMPVCAIPAIFTLMIAARRAKVAGKLQGFQTLKQLHGSYGALVVDLFWRLDSIGLLLICGFLSLILLPMTIAGGTSSRWGHADVIVMLVIGVLLVPVFVLWEMKYARFPVMPFHLLKDRSVIGGMGCAVFLNCVWYLQGDYLYTVLVVAFDQSILSATRISFLYSFVSVLTGLVVGLVVRYVRYIKWFAVAGVCLFALGMGLLVRFRGIHGNGDTAGIIGSQIVLGFAGGFTPYSVQALVQAATKHEHVALVTALYLAAYNVGSAIGGAISGAIWTNTLPGKLESYLGNSTLATAAYDSPLTFVLSYPFGTPERTAVVHAYNDTQRLLCIAGVCLCVPFLACALVLRNPRLVDRQSLENAEREQESVDDGASALGEVNGVAKA
ncbi:hypothetical protein M0805_008044 [Coniferiporia weirii]|nr:hypothetical protein M0805_008044 [Coniferiporia weirii]